MARTRSHYRHSGPSNGIGSVKWLVPIVVTIGLALGGNIVTTALWAGKMSERMDTHDRAIASLQSKSDRISIIETRLESINETLKRLEAAISRQNGRPR